MGAQGIVEIGDEVTLGGNCAFIEWISHSGYG